MHLLVAELRNGYYYIFAPAGGVSTGWQLILRSKNPYGPYEEHISLAQGNTPINGPHQGAWIDTESGEDWFVHFQDVEAYGRITHLQPMKWNNDWPIMGEDPDGDGTGQPVLKYIKPNVTAKSTISTPADSDEFDGNDIGLQWQWQANPVATWAFANPAESKLRLFTAQLPEDAKNLWDAPNLLLQKFPAEEFTTTTSLEFFPNPKLRNEQVGLIVMGMSYAYLALESTEDGISLNYVTCLDAEHGKPEVKKEIAKLDKNTIQLRVKVSKGGVCTFSYSEDGEKFEEINESFTAVPGKWIGAKVGLFAIRNTKTNDSGFADVDWFRFKK